MVAELGRPLFEVITGLTIGLDLSELSTAVRIGRRGVSGGSRAGRAEGTDTGWWAIGSATGLGWSAVIVAVIWGIIGAVLATVGRNSLKVRARPAENRGHREEDPGRPQRQRITRPDPSPPHRYRHPSAEYEDDLMSNDPEQIRREIERTRTELSDNVNALGDKVNPGSIAKRQVGRVRGAADLGQRRRAGQRLRRRRHRARVAGTMGDAVSDAPTAVARKAQGSPIAAAAVRAASCRTGYRDCQRGGRRKFRL